MRQQTKDKSYQNTSRGEHRNLRCFKMLSSELSLVYVIYISCK